jgi:hypothetical protein
VRIDERRQGISESDDGRGKEASRRATDLGLAISREIRASSSLNHQRMNIRVLVLPFNPTAALFQLSFSTSTLLSAPKKKKASMPPKKAAAPEKKVSPRLLRLAPSFPCWECPANTDYDALLGGCVGPPWTTGKQLEDGYRR